MAVKTRQRRSKGTTQPGYENRNHQVVIGPTGERGSDHNSYLYLLRCGVCKHEYKANGTDIWQRRCPSHDKKKRR